MGDKESTHQDFPGRRRGAFLERLSRRVHSVLRTGPFPPVKNNLSVSVDFKPSFQCFDLQSDCAMPPCLVGRNMAQCCIMFECRFIHRKRGVPRLLRETESMTIRRYREPADSGNIFLIIRQWRNNDSSYSPGALSAFSVSLYMQFIEPLSNADGFVDAAWDYVGNHWQPGAVEILKSLASLLTGRFRRWRNRWNPSGNVLP